MKSITSEEVALLHQILQPYHAVSVHHTPRPSPPSISYRDQTHVLKAEKT